MAKVSPAAKTRRAKHSPPSVIDVKNLRKSFGEVKAVDGISFSVSPGEIFGILGPNGAGKTTTLEMIEGLQEIGGGRVKVDGIDVAEDPQAVKHRIGVQLQSSAFFEKLRLTELLELFGSLYGRRVDAAALLADVGLEEKARAYPEQLSGGQRQRFSIASALVNDPVALFLDEPTTGLDPQARRHLWDLVEGIRKRGKTVILTTHYMEEAEVLCDRVAIMDRGKIVALDTPDHLITDLLKTGFKKKHVERGANLEDVFIALTGHGLREE